MRAYVVKDLGTDKSGKRICQIWTTRRVARELYEVLLDGKGGLLVDSLMRSETNHITLTLSPLADDTTITEIRQVVGVVQEEVVSSYGDELVESDFVPSNIIAALTGRRPVNLKSLGPGEFREEAAEESDVPADEGVESETGKG